MKFGLAICEDAWFDEPAASAKAAGAEVLCVLNASPFHLGKVAEREERMADRAKAVRMPLLYAHLTGGQDEVVFDGASFAVDAQGRIAARAPMFEDALLIRGRDRGFGSRRGRARSLSRGSSVGGTGDGCARLRRQERLPGSADRLERRHRFGLAAGVAVDALGAEKVRTVMMPSPYTADISWIDARDMAQRLGVRYDEISIVPMFDAFRASLASEFADRAEDATEENIQARLRGTLLMALSNKFGSIVLTTGNKSEMAKATARCTVTWRAALP